MSRPITIFTGQWTDLSLEEMCATAKKMGYEGLEIATGAQLDVSRAAQDLSYVEEIKKTLEKYELICWAIRAHVQGQCVGDSVPYAYDPRLDGFAPAQYAGKPEEMQQWAIA